MSRRADWLFVFFAMLAILGLGAILGTCMPQPARAQCQNPYCPGGTAVRVYDGGTGAHDAFNARRNLGITAGALTGLRDSLSSIYYSAIQDPLLRVKDSQFFVKNASDTTKKFQFDASGIATGTTRLFSMPNKAGTIALLEDLSGGGLNVYDPLLRVKDVQFFIKDDGDTTKKLQLNLANLTTATTRTDSVPDVSSLLAAARHTNTFSRQQTFTSNTDEALVVLNGSSANTIPAFQVFDETSNYLAYIDNGGFVAGVGGFGIINPLTGDFVQVVNKSAISVSRSYKIDNTITGTPDFVMTSGTQTISGAKTTNGSFVMNAGRIQGRWPMFVDGTAARVSFADQADSSKKVALNASQVTTATTRADTLQDRSGWLGMQVGSRDFTAQTANISSTNIASPSAGVYTVKVYGVVTSVLGAAVTLTVGWTDAQQAQTATATFATPAGSYVTINIPVQVASGNITLSSSGYSSGTYSVYTRVTSP